ncbi:unnamed protein product [Periconia digitata]|uniref:Secreted protein n=1 Tax=Periconia digitata TaxID=1303443 RepID=A0A9W4UIE3_9PLEO|nr:unnamed protein product [Periconia digitata]
MDVVVRLILAALLVVCMRTHSHSAIVTRAMLAPNAPTELAASAESRIRRATCAAKPAHDDELCFVLVEGCVVLNDFALSDR